MCKFCEWGIGLLSVAQDLVLGENTISKCTYDVFISTDKDLVISGIDTRNMEQICDDRLDINYCPMCGKLLNRSEE